MEDRTLRGLALFGALGTTFDLFHEALDHWFQPNWAACNKRLYGHHLVYVADGMKVGEEEDDRSGWPTMTATQLGRRACTFHVGIYTLGQVAGTVAVTRLVGFRISPAALAVGAVINAATHWPLDRGATLRRLASAAGKTGYLSAVTVVRKPGGEADSHGAGTAWNELDRSAHRAVGWVATAVTTGLALWRGDRK